MDLSDEDKSMRLYETLVQIGVFEGMRKVCREWIIHDTTKSIELSFSFRAKLLLHFGSSIEGSSFNSLKPDLDIVILTDGRVINDASDGNHEKKSHLIVPSTFPGYVKLELLSFGKTPDKTFIENCPWYEPDKSGRLWLKGVYEIEDLEEGVAESFKERIKRDDIGTHGPAIRITDMDLVTAFNIYDVLHIMSQWMSRKRVYEWPNDHLRKRCLECPTFLVKVGHPLSEEKDIEWRISFSSAERELMFTLNPTQHKCYVTLKMIKHDLLNQALSEEFITSYHLKTCVFWAVENTPEEMWRPDQLLRCVSICLWYLLYFVLIKNCPNYFLPSANLFQRPAFLDVQSSRLNVIIHSVTGLVDVICRIKCADVGLLFTGRFSTKTTEIIEPCILDFHDIAEMRLSILNSLHGEIDLMAKVELKCSSIETRIKQWKHMLEDLKSNHIPPIVYARDYFTARLTYLTLLFKLNRLSECEEILKDLNKIERRSVYCQCKLVTMPNKITDFIEQDITTLFKNQVTCMVFMPEEKAIVPEPLAYELNLPIDNQANGNYFSVKDIHQWASVDGRVYFLFMGYLVYSGLNDVTMKKEFLQVIRLHVARKENLFHHVVTYNLMGWICAREGMLSEALNWWRTSFEFEENRHRNAVNRYCVEFFSKCAGLGKYIKHN